MREGKAYPRSCPTCGMFGECRQERTPNPNEVICPSCTHQFQAIPVNVQAELAALRDEWEVRADGQRVRKDRWQAGIRRIVALLWGNRHEFEVDEVVEAVRKLCPQPKDDDEGLANGVLNRRATEARDAELLKAIKRAVGRLIVIDGGPVQHETIEGVRESMKDVFALEILRELRPFLNKGETT